MGDDEYVSSDSDSEYNISTSQLLKKQNIIECAENFQYDILLFLLGIFSGGFFGYSVAAGSLVMGINMLSEKYIRDVKITNNILFSLYIIFTSGILISSWSYRSIAACEIGLNLDKSLKNMDIDPKRAVLLSLSMNLLFNYSDFGMTVIFMNSVYRVLESYDFDFETFFTKLYSFICIKLMKRFDNIT